MRRPAAQARRVHGLSRQALRIPKFHDRPEQARSSFALSPVASPQTQASFVLKGGRPAAFQKGLGVEVPEDFDQGRHQPGPSGLMTGADTGAVIPVEILVEQQAVAPVGIALELLGSPEYRPPAGLVSQEDAR